MRPSDLDAERGSEADLAEQRLGVLPDENDTELTGDGLPAEADPADVLDQHRSVPMDEDDH